MSRFANNFRTFLSYTEATPCSAKKTVCVPSVPALVRTTHVSRQVFRWFVRAMVVSGFLGLSASWLPARETTVGFSDFARDTWDLERLPRLDFTRTRMESSFDRSGGNQDGFDPARLRDNVYTIAELNGPGVVRRFYSARPNGRLQVFIDGSAKPAIDMPAVEFFAGRRAPFLRPGVGPSGFAHYSYIPIPYERSLRMQVIPLGEPGPAAYGFYYQVTYETFRPGTKVRSFSLPLRGRDAAEWERTLQKWRRVGQDPKPTQRRRQEVKRDVLVPVDAAESLFEINGAGSIDQLHLAVQSEDPVVLRATLLQIRWDGEEETSVDCPVGDFFGNGFSAIPYRSLAMGLTDTGYYSYFPMPFGKRARITIANESHSSPVHVRVRVFWHRADGMAPDVGYFHAKWRRERVVGVNLGGHNLTGEQNYRVLNAQGAGRFIGLNLNVFNEGLHWWGEGDPMIFVDDDTWPPSIHGTGTEEYFNDAYGFHQHIESSGADPAWNEPNVIPTSGVLLPGIGAPSGCFGPNAVFAFHFGDSVMFRDRLMVTFEHGTENNRTNDYASTAYWYARPHSRDAFVMPPLEARVAPPPERWAAMRAEREQRSLPRLRQQLAEIAREIQQNPTDPAGYKKRVDLLWSALMVPGTDKLPDNLRARLQNLVIGGIDRPFQEQYSALNEVLLEIARRVLGPDPP
jgi:hypothetical protein